MNKVYKHLFRLLILLIIVGLAFLMCKKRLFEGFLASCVGDGAYCGKSSSSSHTCCENLSCLPQGNPMVYKCTQCSKGGEGGCGDGRPPCCSGFKCTSNKMCQNCSVKNRACGDGLTCCEGLNCNNEKCE